ncbi:ecdysone 20-monooxygenase-like [Ixodes scapularis]|uniref:ecdysone 20-monooxygenase-like n=1 Tax=Ixodes scapularis TaxID=6945 RepID=UPI001C38B45C|nr:ecdysone 20-monooxygenase-like [Ixodes scapularis]
MKATRALLRVPRRAAHPGPAAALSADGSRGGESRVTVKPFGQMPRVPSFPLVGSSWIYWPFVGKYHPDRRHEAALDMHRQYGPIVAEKLPGRYSLVHLFSADDFHALYQHEGKTPFRMGVTAFKKYRSSRPEYYKNIGILNM